MYYMYMYIYIYIYIYIYTHITCSPPRRTGRPGPWPSQSTWRSSSDNSTVSFHKFKSRNFKLSVSNPESKYVAYLSVLSQISHCQGLGRKNKHDILKTDHFHCVFVGPRPWHIEIRHRVKKTSTMNLFGFEPLKLKTRRLKLWKPTVIVILFIVVVINNRNSNTHNTSNRNNSSSKSK